MPRYDFRCRQCGDTFELSRPMADAAAPAACPQGHTDTVKLISTFGVTTSSGGSSLPISAPPAASGGGCCGGGGCC